MVRNKVIQSVLVLLLIVGAVLGLKIWDHLEDQAEYRGVNVLASKIKVGMEFSEVIEILGEPWGAAQVYDGGTRFERFWPQNRYAVAISFRQDKVSDVGHASVRTSIFPVWVYELLDSAGITF